MKQVKIGAILSYLSIGINIILTLIYTPWMIEKIGQEHYGLYTLATSLISFVAFDFGMSAAVSRFLSKYRADGDTGKIGEFLSAAFQIYFLIDIVLLIIFLLLYLLIEVIYSGLTPDEVIIFKQLYLIIAFYTFISFPGMPLNGILTAYEKFIPLKTSELLQRLLTVALVVLFLLKGADVVYIVLANTLAGIVGLLFRIAVVRKSTYIYIKLKNKYIGIYKEIFSFSIWSAIGNMATNLTYSLVPSIFAITLNSKAIALYSPASVLGSYFYSIASAVNGMFLPTISKYIAKDKEEEVTQLMIKVGRYQTFALGLIYIGYVCIGDIFIRLWLGDGFSESYLCAVFTMLPLFFRYTQQVGNTAIIAKNYVKEQGKLFMLVTVIGNILVIIFSKNGGLIGGCIALSITTMLYVVGMNYIQLKKINIDLKKFYRECYSSALFPAVIVLILGRFIIAKMGNMELQWLIIKGMIIGILYVGLMWSMSMRRDEKAYIIYQFKRIFKNEV